MPEGARGWGNDMVIYLPMTKAAVRGLDLIEQFMKLGYSVFFTNIFILNYCFLLIDKRVVEIYTLLLT